MLNNFNRSCLKLNTWLRFVSTTPVPDIDLSYYCNPKHAQEIENNIKIRKGVGDHGRVLNIFNIFKSTATTDEVYQTIRDDLYKELCTLPNKTHSSVINYVDPQVIAEVNQKKDFKGCAPLEFSEITRRLNLVRTDKLGHTCGHKSYYFLGELAELEEALIKYTVNKLLMNGFNLVSVPDILPRKVLESCGMTVNTDRTQVLANIYNKYIFKEINIYIYI